MEEKQINGRKVWESAKPFVFGGLAGMMATSIIQPLDFFKVRLQLIGEGTMVAQPSVLNLAPTIIRNEGVRIMYTGLSAALLRQATYTTARMGIFRSMSDALSQDGQPLPFYKKAGCGLVAGALGSFVGNPADLALRMQADGSLPLEQRRHYRNALHALQRIVKEEGVLRLWRGAGPTVTRAMAVNVAMLATYDHAKEAIIKHWTHEDSFATQVGASSISGLSIAVFSLPFDFVKTRIQKMKPLPDGSMPYHNSVDCARKVLRHEGAWTFYRGFSTYYARCAPHAMLVLLFMERLQLAAGKIGL